MAKDKFLYNDDAKTILYRVPIMAKVIIPNNVVTIYGKNEKDYAFYDVKDTLTTVVFEEGNNLKSISEYAFYHCINLQSVDISKCTKLKTIGHYAFSRCTKIESFTFPEGTVTTLGDRVFENDESLQSIHLPASIETIGVRLLTSTGIKEFVMDPEIKLKVLNWGCLYECKNLESFIIPKNVEWAKNIFYNNTKLINVLVANENQNYESIEGVVYSKGKKHICLYPSGRVDKYKIRDGTEYIDYCAFNTAHLCGVELPSSLIGIDEFGLSGLNLSTLIIPKETKLYRINQCAFSGTLLTEVILPETVKIIDDLIFSNCKQLLHVYMPSGITSLGGGIFSGCSEKLEITTGKNSNYQVSEDKFVYSQIIDAEGHVLEGQKRASIYFGTSENIVIKKDVKEIGARLFFKNTVVKTIEFEPTSTLSIIRRNAFTSSGITTITLPNTVEEIHKEAFQFCLNLKTITLSSSLKYLGLYAMANNPKLETVKFVGETLCEVDDFTFMNCNQLSNVDFANGIKNISKQMFYFCTNLKTLSIPKSIEQIDSFAFQYSSIDTITISSEAQLSELPSKCFDECRSLVTISLPPSISAIGSHCFAGTKIKHFTVPNNVEFLSPFCFKDCNDLETFNIEGEAKLKRIRYGVFKGCMNFAKITCNSPSFSLNNGALYNKEETVLIVVPPKLNVKFFAFPDTLKTIGENALYSCININQILIPSKSVEVIENNAFEDCVNLNIINIPICTKDIQKEAFKGCNNLQCELQIENKNQEFRKKLVDVALLPRICLTKCEVFCTVSSTQNALTIVALLASFFIIAV